MEEMAQGTFSYFSDLPMLLTHRADTVSKSRAATYLACKATTGGHPGLGNFPDFAGSAARAPRRMWGPTATARADETHEIDLAAVAPTLTHKSSTRCLFTLYVSI